MRCPKTCLRQTGAYLPAPDFGKGVALHDAAARVCVACNTRVADAERLVGIFHAFKRAIPLQDAERLSVLLEQIR